MDEDVEIRERLFHNVVREYVIGFLLFILLYIVSYVIICAYRKQPDRDEYYAVDTEDATVYRIALWLCTFTLSVSGGAVLLLPISIVANEALLMFPNSYYLQWMNTSLIHGLWNSIFLFSNLSLFVLMPFAYLFTESEGLPGYRRGIMSRVCETALVLFLSAVLICGLAWVLSAIFNEDKASRKALFDIWDFYLPYLYSCISLLGVVMLLICTPIGFARLFTVMGELVMKPKFLQNVETELDALRLEEDNLLRKLENVHRQLSNGHGKDVSDSKEAFKERLDGISKSKRELEKRQKVSPLRRNLGYPIMMLFLLFLTCISVLMVAKNMIELLIGLKALPVSTQEIVLGISSLSALGPIGAAVEITIIIYLMVTSVVGFYSCPLLNRLQPRYADTSMTKVIGNCAVIVVLSSALPVLSRTLGITNFDLLGNFGRLDWLGNFYIILTYNLVFAVATAICLATKFTSSLRAALVDHFEQAFVHGRQTLSRHKGLASATMLVKDD